MKLVYYQIKGACQTPLILSAFPDEQTARFIQREISKGYQVRRLRKRQAKKWITQKPRKDDISSTKLYFKSLKS